MSRPDGEPSNLSTALRLTTEEPWPGLQSYDERAREFFFGREAEIDALRRLVRRERLTILYGQSGLGKTSLLCAGLFPRIRENGLLPIRVRLDYRLDADALSAQVKMDLARALDENGIDARPPGEGESLWEYFHRSDIDFWDPFHHLVTIVLVFDQFEEVFTLGRRTPAERVRVAELVSELSDLIGNRVPTGLRTLFEVHPERAEHFDFDRDAAKVVLSLREDFLPELEGLREALPGVLQNRFRLLPMSRSQALEVVRRPSEGLSDDRTAAAIVDHLTHAGSGRPEGDVEPALLGLLLSGLNARRRALGERQLSADMVSVDRDRILDDFYEGALAGLPPESRLFVEDGLLTASGYRDSVALENAYTRFGLSEEIVGALVNRRLIRREERFGSTRLELVHDVLTGVIAEGRRRRIERQRREQERREEWGRKNDTALSLAARLNATASDWAKDPRGRVSLLLKLPTLCHAGALLATHPTLLDPTVRAFVLASQQARAKSAVIWYGVAVFAIVLSCWSYYRDHANGILSYLFILAAPPVLAVLDRRTGSVSLSSYTWNARRWSVYGWVSYLFWSYSGLTPGDLILSVFAFCFHLVWLLIPAHKWRSLADLAGSSLVENPRAARSSIRVGLGITAALPVVVLIAFVTLPGGFKQGGVNTTRYQLDHEGWVVVTVTSQSGFSRRTEEVRYFEPAEVEGGYHRVTTHFDGARKVEVLYQDVDGRPIESPDGGEPP